MFSAHIPDAFLCAARDISIVPRTSKNLKAEGVIKLICGEYQFPDDEDHAKKLHLEMDCGGKFVHVAMYKTNK